LEDAADAFRGDGHDVTLGIVRHPTLGQTVRRALVQPMAAEIADRAARFAPDLVLAIGGFHAPAGVIEALRERRIAAPIVGWVGDAFGAEAAPLAAIYDLVAHTDSDLEARHRALGFASPAVWLPHAANPHRKRPRTSRSADMVFVAAASPERRRIVEALAEPVVLYGPGWSRLAPRGHRVRGGRVSHHRLGAIYAAHAASLNIRNAANVVAGLNQRNFDPYLFGAAVIGDDQPDLARCFEPGVETLVFRSIAELDALHAKLKRDATWTAGIAAKGLARIQAEHTFAHRLLALMRALG
jgi:spore maturation protein CgeB